MTPSLFRSLAADPFWNLAVEAWLLQQLPADTARLFLYVNAPTVVLGCNQNPWRESDPARLARHNIHLARRASGGGAVYHDPGNLNVSLLVPRSRHQPAVLEALLTDALADLGLAAAANPRHGLECGGRKVSGGAFQLTRDAALHHATLLVATDLAALQAALQPAGVAARTTGQAVASVRATVANLAAFRPGLTPADAAEAIIRRWTGGPAGDAEPLAPGRPWPPPDELEARRAEFASWEWRFGRTPDFTVHDWQPEAGRPPLTVRVHQGRITAPPPLSDSVPPPPADWLGQPFPA